MEEEKYYLVELPLSPNNFNSSKELLFGKWLSRMEYIKFIGISMQKSHEDNFIRDTLNHTLNPHALNGENALEINLRTYEVVIKWFDEFVNDANEWINIVPDSENEEEGMIIQTSNCICITPFAKAIHSDNYEDTLGIDLGDLIIDFGSNYCPFPSIVLNGSNRNLDFYWDLMKVSKIKHINHKCCKLLICALNERYNKLFDSITYIHQYKYLY